MQITKKEIIQKLYDIEENEGLKLGREVQKVIRSEIIPIDVIKLINKYDKEFLRIYDTYNTIYEARYKNPLYRNLKNRQLSIPETAVAISSLMTKIMISCTKIEDETERRTFAAAMNVDKLNAAITSYAIYQDDSDLTILARQVRELLEILYVD